MHTTAQITLRFVMGGVRVVERNWAVAAIVAVWWIWVTVHHVSDFVLPSPPAVARTMYDSRGLLLPGALATGRDALIGLALGMSLGFCLAIVAWSSTLLNGLSSPIVVFFRSVPIVTIVPVLARLVGYGPRLVPVVATIICFFPAFAFGTSGLVSQPPNTTDLFLTFGASRRDALLKLHIPSAVPNLLIALRISAAASVTGALFAEYLVGSNGLGAAFANSLAMFDNSLAFGAAMTALVMTMVLYAVAASIEQIVGKRFRN